ncbi:MAG: type II CAAX endopeptidase family protein [Acidobacteriota bacterium]|nr:type II CAAX endopeptidase family protein [Acidobacteriota bacterium]
MTEVEAEPSVAATGSPSFVDAGRSGLNGFWRYAVGAVLVALVYLGASAVSVIAMFLLSGGSFDVEVLFDSDTLPAEQLLALVMLPAVGLLIGTMVVVLFLHRRSMRSVFTGAATIRWSRVALGAALWAGLTAALELVAFALDPGNYGFSFEAARFWPVAVVAILLVPIQSAAEELFFRGYLLQGLGVVLGRPWAAVLITSVGFGLLHGANPEMEQFGQTFLLYYIGMGLLLALVTLLDGGLELAIGAHAANNLYGALIVSFPGSVLDMPAIFRMVTFPVGQMSIFGAVAGLAFFLVLRRASPWGRLGAILLP